MYLKKMLFAVVGVAMLFSGTFPAAAQEQKDNDPTASVVI